MSIIEGVTERKERRALKSLSFVRDSCEEEVEGYEMESSKEKWG